VIPHCCNRRDAALSLGFGQVRHDEASPVLNDSTASRRARPGIIQYKQPPVTSLGGNPLYSARPAYPAQALQPQLVPVLIRMRILSPSQ
jgi:hypothetical protein